MRLAMVFGLSFLVACSDPNDPGDPLPLTPQSLEGQVGEDSGGALYDHRPRGG